MGSPGLRFESTAEQRFFTGISVPGRRLRNRTHGGNKTKHTLYPGRYTNVRCGNDYQFFSSPFRTSLQALGVDRYSMLGWCYGGCTALIAASKAADRVEKLVVWSCNAYVTHKDLEYYETTRDINNWSPQMRLSQVAMYGERYAADTWAGWIDAIWKILDEHDGDLCRGALACKINAPTLIMHGALDVLVSVEHAVYLHENIKNST